MTKNKVGKHNKTNNGEHNMTIIPGNPTKK